MEVQVCGVDGLPDDSIISIKTGSSRRQAQVSQLGPNSPAFTFPVSSAEDVKIKIDVMRSVGSRHMALRPEEGIYEIEMGEANDINLKLGVRGKACEKPQRSLMKAEANTKASEGYVELGGHAQQHRDYLEDEGVLKLMKSLLATVVLEQPEDPYSFMAEQFGKARFSRTDPTARKLPSTESSPSPPPGLPTTIQADALQPPESQCEAKAMPSELSPPTPSQMQASGLQLSEDQSEAKAIPRGEPQPVLPKARVDTLEGQCVAKVTPETNHPTCGERPIGIQGALKTLADLSLSGELASSLRPIGLQGAFKTLADLSLSGELASSLAATPQNQRSADIEVALSATLNTTGQLASTLKNDRSANIAHALATLASLSTSGELGNSLAAISQTQRAEEIQLAVNQLAILSASGELSNALASSPPVDWPENVRSALSTLAALSTNGHLQNQLPVDSHTDVPDTMQTTASTLTTLSTSANLVSTLANNLQSARLDHVQNSLSTLAALSTSGELENILATKSQPEINVALQTVVAFSENLSSTLAANPEIKWPEHVQTALNTLASVSVSGELAASSACAMNSQADRSSEIKAILNALANASLSGELPIMDDLAPCSIGDIETSKSEESDNIARAQVDPTENVKAASNALSTLSLSGESLSAIVTKQSGTPGNIESEQADLSDKVKAALSNLSELSTSGQLPNTIQNDAAQPLETKFEHVADGEREATSGASFSGSIAQVQNSLHPLEKEKIPFHHLPSAGGSVSRRLLSSFTPASLPSGTEVGTGGKEIMKESRDTYQTDTGKSQNCDIADMATLNRPLIDTVKKAGAVEQLLHHQDLTVRTAVREALMAAGIDQSHLPEP
mmetsp:Transcript_6085/g.9849  ORF Transcript_6085/g.9849 Transcript_6085/m.9849 type:complete len:855 (+) Transcript_6085:51-2615(+)